MAIRRPRTRTCAEDFLTKPSVAEIGGEGHCWACGRLWESTLDKYRVLDPLGYGSFYQLEYT